MSTKPRVLKIAALASSALLMGAFVAYRAGAFDGAEPAAASPAAAPSPVTMPPLTITPSATEWFGGSKSAAIITVTDEAKPATAPVPTAPGAAPSGGAAAEEDSYFPGSKSMVGAPRKRRTPPPAPAPDAASKPAPTPDEKRVPAPSA